MAVTKYYSVDLLEELKLSKPPRYTTVTRRDQLNDAVSQWLFEKAGVRYTGNCLLQDDAPQPHWTLSHDFRDGQLVITVNFTDAATATLFKLTWL